MAVILLWIGAHEVLVKDRWTALIHCIPHLCNSESSRPLKALSQLPATAQVSLAAAERLFDVLTRLPSREDTGTIARGTLERDIRFEDVTLHTTMSRCSRTSASWRRRGRSPRSLGQRCGEIDARHLIKPRFYPGEAGRILLDGIDIAAIQLPSLRRLAGIVSQDPVLFNDTVRNTLPTLRREHRDEQIRAAAERQMPIISSLNCLSIRHDPRERGTRLSGGQRQRRDCTGLAL